MEGYDFAPIDTLTSGHTQSVSSSFATTSVRYYDDVNCDGQTDIVVRNNNTNGGALRTTNILINTGTSYEAIENGWLVPGLDLNRDGRIDYLYFNGKQNFIRYRQPDGSYREEYMQLMTVDEYSATYDPDQWQSSAAGEWNGLLPKPAWDNFLAITGGSLGGLGCYNCTSAQRVVASQAVDINADGLIDLVDSKNGMIYLNMGEGQWVYINAEGQLTLADFNNDGYQDILIPGDETKLLLYNIASRTYVETTLFSDLPTDPDIYAYDFDRDGDVDILVTFSAPNNNTHLSYTMFFSNNGSAQFTQVEEQGYDEKLLFSNLNDIDGDGYYDLLAYEVTAASTATSITWTGKILWLKGQNNMTFATPQELFEQEGSNLLASYSLDHRINAEDLNGDGSIDIWVSGVYRGTNTDTYTNIYGMNATAVANTAPTAPAKPELIYEDGVLAIEWGNGSDAQTMACDLTYALRIGTVSGGEDIMVSHANADGTRRNFEDGNMGRKHSYTIDLRTYAPSTIYVSVQAVDAQHTGSAWSEEATIAHTALPATFSLGKTVMNLNDTLLISFTPVPDGYTHSWQIEDGNLLQNLATAGSEQAVFSTGGEKRITHTLTAPDGFAATYTATVNVTSAGVKSVPLERPEGYNYGTTDYVLFGDNPLYDYNFDGLLDGIYNNAIYKSDANFNFTVQSGIWNSNLFIGSPMWVDWTHNGAADLIFTASTPSHSSSDVYYLPHNGTSTFSSKQADENVRVLYNGVTSTNSNYYHLVPPVDFTHNGHYDVFKTTGTNAAAQSPAMTDCWIMTRGSDGSFSRLNSSGSISDMSTFYDVWGRAGNSANQDVAYQDIDHNGFVDILYMPIREENHTEVAFDKAVVYLNHGNGRFEQLVIPFEQELSARSNTVDMNSLQWVDMNADGYLDIVAYNNAGAPYILYNEANTSFAAPQVLSLGELQSYYKTEGNILIADIDNNGYPDVVTVQEYGASDQPYGIYVHYFNAEGVMAQGFIVTQTYNTLPRLLYNNNRLYLYSGDRKLYEVVSQANERPSAPTGVRAVQTAEGLLVEWNAAEDDHTPAILMEYNLSVKHAGQTGANAYAISPQNGGNANAAYLPGYKYISATQFLIPMSALTVGDYEIQVQAIDGGKRMSEFSPVVSLHLDRQLIEAPTTACVDAEAVVSYAGTAQSGGTPVWDFDGATIVSGSGFGPYRVIWSTAGNKTITLTLGSVSAQRMIVVDVVNAGAGFALPQYLFEGGQTTVNLPKNMSAAWTLYLDGIAKPVTSRGIQSADKRMTIENGVITVNPSQPVGYQVADPLGNHSLVLELKLTNVNGCTETYQQVLTILSDSDQPQISLVTPDANGHNVISWSPSLSTIYPQMRVLKETNAYGQFIELTTMSTAAGSFTDLSSNTDQRAERYAITGILAGGSEAPRSTVHQTVHMTINRGIQDNTFNLIWNNYQGAEVATYNILRGSSETTLTQIASVSSANISYTDNSPLDAQPVYAIEYVLSGAQASNSPAKAPARTNTGALTGRSNVVNRSASRSLVYATSMAIYSANGSYATTADKPMLLLYAEIMPTTATYKSAQWSIVSGADLATIDANTGILTAKNPNTGGTMTVKATATDGSGVTATRIITIAAIQDNTTPVDDYYTIRFLNYDGAELQNTQVKEGEMPAYTGATPTKPEDEDYTYAFSGWEPAIAVATADADYTAQFTATEKQQPTDYTPTGLVASQEGTIVWLDWNAVEGVSLYEWEFLNNGNSIGGNITDYLYGGLNFEGTPAGSYPLVCRVRSLDNNQQPLSDWASVEFTLVIDEPAGIEDINVTPSDAVRKVIHDGILYIIRPDGTIYNATGVRVK